MSQARLIFRADGNERIGLGHVMRLLALAEIAGEASDVPERVFVTRPGLPAATAAEVRAGGLTLREIPADVLAGDEAAWLSQHVLTPTDALILDGYDFDFSYQTTVRAAAGALLYIDDLLAFPQAADVVLNPAGGVTAADYDLQRPGARLLSGPAWAPLRQPFRAAALRAGEAAPVGHVLLCLGGADPANHTYRLAAELLQLPNVEHLHVAVGSAYQHWETLAAWASGEDESRLTLYRALAAADFCALLAACGAALTSASTVSYEYASVGGGMLTVLKTAENQRRIYDFLLREGMARPATALSNMLSAPDRGHTQVTLRAAQRRHFDGAAPARLRRLLLGLRAQASLRLRPVTAADADLLLRWANDSVVRQNSYSTAPIALADHQRWLAAKLADATQLLFVATVAGEPAGTIRFARGPDQHSALLSFALDARFRGLSLGAPLLLAGAAAAFAHWGPDLHGVRGHVLVRNDASRRAFQRAGFTERNDLTTPAASVSFERLR